MSDNGTLASALLAAQKAMPAIHKDSKAEVVGKTRDGKPYKYSYGYLSLQRLLEIVLPVLNDAGLALSQMPSVNDLGHQVLKTTLWHGASADALTEETPLILSGDATPQTWGGAVTYARRYALTALLGIAADEDDDAAAASKPRNTTARTAAATREDAPAPAAGAGASSPGPASTPQNARIHAIISDLAKQRDVPRDQVQAALKEALGIESMSNLSAENAKRASEILEGWQKKVGATA